MSKAYLAADSELLDYLEQGSTYGQVGAINPVERQGSSCSKCGGGGPTKIVTRSSDEAARKRDRVICFACQAPWEGHEVFGFRGSVQSSPSTDRHEKKLIGRVDKISRADYIFSVHGEEAEWEFALMAWLISLLPDTGGDWATVADIGENGMRGTEFRPAGLRAQKHLGQWTAERCKSAVLMARKVVTKRLKDGKE